MSYTHLAFMMLVAVSMTWAADAQESRSPPVFDEHTNTLTFPASKFVRHTAPTRPMSKTDALQHWDGTGELLLEPAGDEGPNSVSGIGATFDNTDASGPDAERSQRFDGRCPEGVMWYQLREGRLALSQSSYSLDEQSPRLSSNRKEPGLLFSTSRCRYRITLETKVSDKGHWVAAPDAPTPEYKPSPPIGPVFHVLPNEKVMMDVGPLPQELVPTRQTSLTGSRISPEVKDVCPSTTGMTTLEPRGVFFSQVSPSIHDVIIGVRREPELKETSLIFQNERCREEIHVSREILREGVWKLSDLSANPPSAGEGTDAPAR